MCTQMRPTKGSSFSHAAKLPRPSQEKGRCTCICHLWRISFGRWHSCNAFPMRTSLGEIEHVTINKQWGFLFDRSDGYSSRLANKLEDRITFCAKLPANAIQTFLPVNAGLQRLLYVIGWFSGYLELMRDNGWLSSILYFGNLLKFTYEQNLIANLFTSFPTIKMFDFMFISFEKPRERQK